VKLLQPVTGERAFLFMPAGLPGCPDQIIDCALRTDRTARLRPVPCPNDASWSVKQHADAREICRPLALQEFDTRGHVYRLDAPELVNPCSSHRRRKSAAARVFRLRMLTVKNSRKRSVARFPANGDQRRKV
jgi:hypothetical protein